MCFFGCFIAVICVMSAVITKRGTEGGNDTIQCPYDRGFKTHQKYLSKGIWANRVDVIKTQTHQHPAVTHKGRFSLYDDTERRVFTVTITNLLLDDSGTYWCGINTWWWYHKTEVRITVDRGWSPVPPNPGSITSRYLLSTTHPSTNITMTTDSSNSTAGILPSVELLSKAYTLICRPTSLSISVISLSFCLPFVLTPHISLSHLLFSSPLYHISSPPLSSPSH
uniref:Immunoglobulin V-set domain-containing protein n=1 Tax=Oncorhynchus tshawytscha TaxID=74940 RepID=A0AAZ3P4Q8_ONCTS